MRFFHERFEDVSALKRALNRPLNKAWTGTKPETEQMSKSFHGVSNFADAMKLFEDGDVGLAKKVAEAKIPAMMTAPKRRRVYSPVGGTVCVPKLLSGEPYCMRRSKKVPDSAKVISIYYNATVSCAYSTEDILQVNKKLVNMVNTLCINGYSIQLYYVTVTSHNGNKYVFSYKIKSFQDSFNLARTAFILGHPSMYRAIWFRYIERCPHEISSSFPNSYGYVEYPSKKDLVRQHIMSDSDYLIDFQKLRLAQEAVDLLK